MTTLPMDYDTFRTQGNTWTCEHCGCEYTDADGGCECCVGGVGCEDGDWSMWDIYDA